MVLVLLIYSALSVLNLLAALTLVYKVINLRKENMNKQLTQETITKEDETAKTSRLSYKRNNLTIEIPSDQSFSENNTKRDLLNYYIENMFPACLYSNQTPEEKLTMLLNWFSVIYFEDSVSLLLIASEVIKKKPDYILLISIVSCFSGVFFSVITRFLFELGKNSRNKKINYICFLIKSVFFAAVWVLALLAHIFITVRYKQPFSFSDYAKCLVIVLTLELSIIELSRSSIKYSLNTYNNSLLI